MPHRPHIAEKDGQPVEVTAEDAIPASRRFFLSGGMMLAGGAIVGTNLGVARSAHAFGSDTIKVGLIGCGARGTGAAIHALNTAADYQGMVKLTALADVLASSVQTAYRTINSKHAANVDVKDRRFVGFDAFRQLLETDVDVVILSTPPGFRPLHFEAAVQANKHVFMEKPVATDSPGVRRVLAANELAKQRGLAVHVGLQRRHEFRYQECIERLQAGAIGDLLFARAYWNGGGAKVRTRTADQTELEFQMRNWGAFTWLGGDHIGEHHIHNLDVINWLMQSHPIEAQGQGGREVREGRAAGQVFDHHMVEFTYPNGFKLFSQCRHTPGCWNSIGEHAHGSAGTADISNALIRDSQGKKVWQSETKEIKDKGLQQEFHDLFASLRSGQISNEADYGAISTMTAIMGRMATYSGQVIKWDQAFQNPVQLANVDALQSFADRAPVQPDATGHYPVAVPGSRTTFGT
jgi:myo-inositol 2-dehydrogenase / D-chiro-inositol 1-dehydrogenase